jgi:hypothetical protein
MGHRSYDLIDASGFQMHGKPQGKVGRCNAQKFLSMREAQLEFSNTLSLRCLNVNHTWASLRPVYPICKWQKLTVIHPNFSLNDSIHF